MQDVHRARLRADHVSTPSLEDVILRAIIGNGSEPTPMERQIATDVRNALFRYGERWQRIGQRFYDDTGEGVPVLMLPLADAGVAS